MQALSSRKATCVLEVKMMPIGEHLSYQFVSGAWKIAVGEEKIEKYVDLLLIKIY